MASLVVSMTCQDRVSPIVSAASDILRTVDGRALSAPPDRLALIGRTIHGPSVTTVELLPSPEFLRWLADVIETKRPDAT